MQLSQSLLDQVLTLANEAGKHLARFYQQDVAIQTKSDNTPVTEADLFVSQFLIEKLTALSTWDLHSTHEAIEQTAAELEVGMGKVGMPLRVAVTGRQVSPPLFESMEILGAGSTLARLKALRARLG